MKNTRKQHLIAALTGALALSTATTTLFAQDATTNSAKTVESNSLNTLPKTETPEKDPWRFSVIPLGWLAGIRGDVTVRGRQVDTDVSFDQILDHLKGIAMADFELQKGKFGIYAQPNWIKLEADGNAGPLNGQSDMQLWIVDAAGFYQMCKWGEEKPVTVDALVGVRYWNIKNDLTLSGPGGILSFNGSSTLSLIDPIVGLRSKIYLTKKLSLNVHGDIGGFGVSEKSSNLSWQALGTLGYDFTRHFSLLAGYRALAVDKHVDDDQKGANLILKGAILGLDFHW